MNTKIVSAICLLVVASTAASAQQADPLSRHLVPPSLIMEKADEIGLSDEQRRTVQRAAEHAHQQATEKKAPLEKAMQALAAELAKDKIDADTARAILDDMLDAERAMKQLQLELLIGANNALTAQQRKTLQKMRIAAHPQRRQQLEERLKAKLQRVQEGLQAKLKAGQHPLEVPDLMQRFPGLMGQGRHHEAEQLLDRVLGILEGNNHQPAPGAPPKKKEAPDQPLSLRSLDQLEAEIATMRVEDVAWRKIDWRTCLLDGLGESRAEDKPIILWVFIDRPVDDKRC